MEERQWLYAILSSTADGIITIDERGAITFCNKTVERMFGYTAAELEGKNVSVLAPSPWRQEHDGYLERYRRTGEARIIGREREVEGQRKDGTRFPMALRVREMHYQGKRLFIGTVQDITARRDAEIERARLITAIEQTEDIVLVTGVEGDIVYVNPAFEKITGHTCEEAIGKNPNFLSGGNGDHEIYAELWRTLAGGDIWKGRFVNKRPDGTRYELSGRIAQVRDPQGKVVNYVGILRDVTRERAREEHLHISERLNSIGRLAGGIAHDFNNLLTLILGYGTSLKKRLADTPGSLEMIDSILSAGNRASDLTRQLLSFSRRQIVSPKVLDVNGVITAMQRVLRPLIREDIEIKAVLAPDACLVEVDPSQFEQVLMNFTLNARDAMPRGGVLTIETQKVVLDRMYTSAVVDVEPGPYVLVAVSDTGAGMDEETKKHIFEPFFTTKEIGKGTGLGLATVFGNIKQGGGHISVYSELGHGSTFKVYLPQAKAAVTAQAPPEVRTAALGGTETILLVEDETALRKMVADNLREQGYRVVDAPDGPAALQASTALKEGALDLLLTDVVMPRMSGEKLARQISARFPDVKVIYMSGYTENAIVHHSVLDPGVVLIQKPFSLDTLLETVRSVLDGKSSTGR